MGGGEEEDVNKIREEDGPGERVGEGEPEEAEENGYGESVPEDGGSLCAAGEGDVERCPVYSDSPISYYSIMLQEWEVNLRFPVGERSRR